MSPPFDFVTGDGHLAVLLVGLATSAVKPSDGFTRLWLSLPVVAGYGTAIYLLSLTLEAIPVGIVYAIWSGAGIVLIAIAATLFLGNGWMFRPC